MDNYILSAVFQTRIEAMMRAHHVPGLSMAIVHKGKVTSAAWGQASLDPPKPCTPDTLFDIASCSKSLTAASVALLVDDDENYPEVQWDAAMSELLPDDFVMPGVGYTEGITVDDILSHRTGMPRHDLSYLGPLASQTDDARSVTRNLRNLSVCAPLRSKFLYNNMMYTVATHLVEVKTKKTFSSFLDENFFVPLGMQSTSLQPSEARRRGLGDRIGTGYDWDKVTSTYLSIEWPDAPEAQGAGLVVSSANDLIKWVKALLHHEGPINGRVYQGLVRLRTMTKSTWKSQKKRRPHATPPVYAAGLEVHTYRGQRVVSHDGSGFGFSGRFFLLPDLMFGGVILGNAEGTFDIQCLVTKELIDELLGVPMPERLYLQQFTKTKKEKKKKTPKPAKVETPLPSPEAPTKSNEESTRPKGDVKSTKEGSKDKVDAEEPGSGDKAEKQKNTPSKTPSNQPQTAPLTAYTGPYWHPGYRQLTVEIREDKLFINAPDRSYGFTLTFEHVADDCKFVAYMKYLLSAGGSSPIDAEFVWENGRVVRMGLVLEEDVKDLVWFEKRQEDVDKVAEGVQGLDVEDEHVN